jgi:exodeoxyribonuclease VIII
MQLGTLTHTALLEPHIYESVKAVEPAFKGTRASKEYKVWLSGVEPEKQVVTREFDENVNLMRESLQAAGLLAVLETGIKEASFFGTFPDSEIRLKCRPDVLNVEKKLIIDLKTTKDILWFRSDAKKLKYPLSVPHYKTIISEHYNTAGWQYLFVAVEPEPPFHCDWFVLGEDESEKARADWLEAIILYEKCVTENLWPGVCQETPKEI